MRQNVNDVRWWREDVSDPHVVVFDVARRITNRTSTRREMDLFAACLYDDSELTGIGPSTYSVTEFSPNQLAFNVIRQTVDTLAAKIAKNQPLPTPVTSGGNYHQKRRAQKFGKAIEGQFESSGVWRTSPTIARDCALFGTGITHNYRVGKTIYHERVFPWEIRIDPREAMRGKPRTIYKVGWIDRAVLADRFPEHEEEIFSADADQFEESDLGYDDTCDQVLVVESWHLPSGSDARDGRHIIAVNNATLLIEEYKRQYFPFSVLRMSDPVVGWHGTGLAKQLTGLQYTINDTAAVVQEAHALAGGYILVESGSTVQTDKLGNGRGLVLEYNGARPEWINPQPLHPDTWNFVLTLIPKAFEMTGVSQLSAQSEKPAGIESAIALTTYNDFETERFVLFAKQYEEYHIDIAWQQFDLMEEISDESGGLKVKAVSRERGQRVLQELEYDKIRLDRDNFVLKVFPTSLLSKKPSARIQEIEQFINAGWISPEDGKMLLNFPDLEGFNNLTSASIRFVEWIVQKMLDAEDVDDMDAYTFPESSFDLKLCIAKALQMYLDARVEEAPEENLELVLTFIADCKELIKRANDNGVAAPATGAAPPEGVPAEGMPVEGAALPVDPMAAPGMGLPPPDFPVPPDAPPPGAPLPPEMAA